MTGDHPRSNPALPTVELRNRLDAAVLRVLRTGDEAALRNLAAACEALHRVAVPGQRALWRLAGEAGLMEARWLASAAAVVDDTSAPGPDTRVKRVAMQLTLQVRQPQGPEARPAASLVRVLLGLALQRWVGGDPPPIIAQASADFLQQAETQSQQLVQAMGAGPLPGGAELETALDAAQALGRNGAAAGLHALTQRTQSLVQALLWVRHASEAGLQADVDSPALQAAAEELRAMLHRHAAGFERPPSAAAFEGLHALLTHARRQLGLPP